MVCRVGMILPGPWSLPPPPSLTGRGRGGAADYSRYMITQHCYGVQGGDDSTRSPESATTTFSDGEGEESEADEGIHLPRKHHKQLVEVGDTKVTDK